MLNAASSYFRDTWPSAALRLNPLNAEARVNQILQMLRERTVSHDALRKAAREGIRFSPLDARFYSLMGIIELRMGRREAAGRFFDHALTLLPAEFQALAHKLVHDLEDDNLPAAIDHMEMIGRRWPGHWPFLEPVLPSLLSREWAFSEIAGRFGPNARLRALLIRSLERNEKSLPFAYDLLLKWHDCGLKGLDQHISRVTSRLVQEKRYADAFLLFRLTRPTGTESEAGYVYNGEFRLPISGNSFDWQIRPQAGVDFQFQEEANDRKSLVVRFLETPIRFHNITQFLRLPPGQYRLSLSFSAEALVAPKPLQVGIRCKDSNKVLVAVALEDGSTVNVENTAGFSVPPENCSLQTLYFFTDPMPLSWRNRYRGVLRVNHVSIAHEGNH